MQEFLDLGECTITESETEDKDWINNWKQYFKQFYVDDILIIPSWEEVKPEDRDKMIIHIDPGTAFGTGMHETTQLCIRQLKKYVTKDTELLDVGTGSGILSIIALKLGARHAVGTDLDPSGAISSCLQGWTGSSCGLLVRVRANPASGSLRFLRLRKTKKSMEFR